MNSDMLAAGVELGDRYEFDLVHGHDWLVANACDHLAKRFDAPLVTTIHATEHGRHQGWVDKHPQTYIHGVERWITNRSERVIACSHYMREQIADIFGVEEERVTVIPNGIDPDDLQPQDPDELRRLRVGVRRARREAGAADRPPRLREGLPAGARGDAADDRGGARHPLPRRRLRHPRGGAAQAGRGARPDGARHLPRLDRRRRPPLALPDRRPDRGPLDLRALRPRRARGDGLGLPLHRRRHRRPARGRPPRGSRPALPRPRPRSARRRRVRVLCDDELGRRLVSEAYEHLRRFDWADVAEQTAAVYAELAQTARA